MYKNKKLYTFVMGVSTTLMLISPSINAESLQELERKKLDLQQNISESTQKKGQLQQELTQLETDLSSLELQLATLTKQLDVTNKEILEKEQSIQNTKEKIVNILTIIKEKEIDLENKKAKLAQNLKLMYSRGNVQFLEFLFRSDNFSQFLFRYEKYNDIMEEGEKLHEEVLEQLEAIKEQKRLLEDTKITLENEKKELEIQKHQQESQKNEQQAVQNSLNEKKSKVQHAIDEEDAELNSLSSAIVEAEKAIHAEQSRIEEARKKAEMERSKKSPITPTSASAPTTETNKNLGQAILASPMEPGTYRMTSPYGYRIHPITGQQKLHNGVDYAASRNTPIYAMEEGYILYAGKANGYGNWIVIKHPNGLYTIYGHMYDDGVYVKPGDYVFRGQKIGGVGSNGQSTGNHLHFCVATSFSGGKFTYVNPMHYIQ